MSDVAYTVYAGFLGLLLLACGVALAKSAFPPPEDHLLPAGDATSHPELYCLGCGHTHDRAQMGWNEDEEFRCTDCCSELAVSARGREMDRAYLDMLLDPAYQKRRSLEIGAQIMAEHRVREEEYEREMAAQYAVWDAEEAARQAESDRKMAVLDAEHYCIRCGVPHYYHYDEGRCLRP